MNDLDSPCPRCKHQKAEAHQEICNHRIYIRCNFCHLQTPAVFNYRSDAVRAWATMQYANPTPYEIEHLQFRDTLEKISRYKKKNDLETDYQSLISIMALAGSAVEPEEVVFSESNT